MLRRVLLVVLVLLLGVLASAPAALAAGTPNVGLTADAPRACCSARPPPSTLTRANPAGPAVRLQPHLPRRPARRHHLRPGLRLLRGRRRHAAGHRRRHRQPDDADLEQRRRPLAERDRHAHLPGRPRDRRRRRLQHQHPLVLHAHGRARTSTRTRASCPPSTRRRLLGRRDRPGRQDGDDEPHRRRDHGRRAQPRGRAPARRARPPDGLHAPPRQQRRRPDRPADRRGLPARRPRVPRLRPGRPHHRRADQPGRRAGVAGLGRARRPPRRPRELRRPQRGRDRLARPGRRRPAPGRRLHARPLDRPRHARRRAPRATSATSPRSRCARTRRPGPARRRPRQASTRGRTSTTTAAAAPRTSRRCRPTRPSAATTTPSRPCPTTTPSCAPPRTSASSRARNQGAITDGQLTRWTLAVDTGEYRYVDDLRVTDTVPDGLCPLSSPALSGDADCAFTAGNAPSAPYTTATENASGTWTLLWDSSTDPALARMQPSSHHEIAFSTRSRTHYQENFNDQRPVLARDSWTNTVDLLGKDYQRCVAPADCDPVGTKLDTTPGLPGRARRRRHRRRRRLLREPVRRLAHDRQDDPRRGRGHARLVRHRHLQRPRRRPVRPRRPHLLPAARRLPVPARHRQPDGDRLPADRHDVRELHRHRRTTRSRSSRSRAWSATRS